MRKLWGGSWSTWAGVGVQGRKLPIKRKKQQQEYKMSRDMTAVADLNKLSSTIHKQCSVIHTSSCVTPRVNRLRHGTEASLMSTSAVTALLSVEDDSCMIHRKKNFTKRLLTPRQGWKMASKKT